MQTDADVNPGTITPLTAAAYAGSTDFIKCLLEAGADANIPDHVCFCLLHSLFTISLFCF